MEKFFVVLTVIPLAPEHPHLPVQLLRAPVKLILGPVALTVVKCDFDVGKLTFQRRTPRPR